MLKQIKKIAVPLLAVVFVLSFVIGYAKSQVTVNLTQPKSAVEQQTSKIENQAQNYNSSKENNVNKEEIKKQEDNDVEKADEENDESNLISKAKISKNEVETVIKSVYPNSVIQKIDIGDENGLIIYEVKITDKSGKVLNVKVDASNGKIVGAENGNSQQEEQKDEDNGHDGNNQEAENEQ